jgi:heptosyltransferase I
MSRLRILLVKLTSLGDVVKALPVLADITEAIPDARVDWLVERPCDTLLGLHPGIDRVIPIELRRFRKDRRYLAGLQGIRADLAGLRERRYHCIVDLQARVKSVVFARMARGPVVGPAPHRGSEPGYRWVCARGVAAPDPGADAISANRIIAARALGYPVPSGAPRFGFGPLTAVLALRPIGPYAVLAHASSSPAKAWPSDSWIFLGRALADQGIRCLLPWGNEQEARSASRLADGIGPTASVTSRLPSLAEWAGLLSEASLVVGLDSGLTHLAAATGVPTLAIFTATSARIFGIRADTPHANLGDAGLAPETHEVVSAARRLLAG